MEIRLTVSRPEDFNKSSAQAVERFALTAGDTFTIEDSLGELVSLRFDAVGGDAVYVTMTVSRPTIQ